MTESPFRIVNARSPTSANSSPSARYSTCSLCACSFDFGPLAWPGERIIIAVWMPLPVSRTSNVMYALYRREKAVHLAVFRTVAALDDGAHAACPERAEIA